jgi:hypothetical protein
VDINPPNMYASYMEVIYNISGLADAVGFFPNIFDKGSFHKRTFINAIP